MSMENTMEEAQEFIDQVIQRFDIETDIFRDFFSSFRFLRYKFDFADDLCEKVQILFKGHTDLIKGIHKFFPKNHRCDVVAGGSGTPPSLPSPPSFTPSTSLIPSPTSLESNGGGCVRERIKRQKSKINRDLEKKECVDYMNRVFRSLDDVEKLEVFLKRILDYQNHKNIDILDEEFLVMFKAMPELHNEFTRFMMSREEEERLLQTQKRNLNETFYTRIHDNPHEKKLFICEESMYEADMAFDLLKSTKKAVERYLKYKRVIEAAEEAAEEYVDEEMGEVLVKFKRGIETDTETEKVEEEEFFGALHKKLIKKLYFNLSYGDDLGEQILDQLLNKQPIIAGERILQRLEEKFEECKIWWEKQKKICKAGFESNYENAMNYKPPSPPPQKKRKRG